MPAQQRESNDQQPARQRVVQGPTVAGSMLVVPVRVDAEGRFALVGPWFRDGSGEVGQATAVASLPHLHPRRLAPQPPPFRSPVSAPKAAGGEVELVVPDATTGAVALVVRGASPAWRSELQGCLLDGTNQVLLYDERLLAPTDADAWQTVMLDPCEDTGLASYGLIADGSVQWPGPTPGRYHVALFVRHEQFANRVRVGTVDVAEHKAVPDAIAIDATALAALRALQQEPPPPPRK